MKTRVFAVCASILAALSLTGCAPKTADWKIGRECEIPMNDQSNFVGFLDDSFGVSVGFGGGIKTSEDGGKTWLKGQNQSMCRYSLDIIDRNLSWTGGNGSHVRVTKDGGKTWEAVKDCRLGSTHVSVDFLDDTTGLIASNKRMAVTGDGGATWAELSPPKGMDDIATVAIRSAKDGYVLTKAGNLYVTNDRGGSWNATSINLAKYKVFNDRIMAADMNFYDDKRGEIVFSGDKKDGAGVWILSTEDGGTTWKTGRLPYPVNSTATEIYLASSGDFVTVTSVKKHVIVFERNAKLATGPEPKATCVSKAE